MRRIGIMGGTFDPIHYGHLIAAEEVRQLFSLEKVIFIPAKIPPHKVGVQMSDPEDRYMMVFLATLDNPYFEVSRIEIEREGISYSVDTVKQLRKDLDEEVEIFFITGMDIVLDLQSWKSPKELLSLCRFIAVTRSGYSLSLLKERLPQEFLEKIDVVEIPSPPISSTEIRNRVKVGKSIRYLVPSLVENYIKRRRLYLI